MGQIVSQGLVDTIESGNKTDSNANVIHQGMKNSSEDIVKSWKVPLFLMSLPVKPLINPFFQQSRKNRINMYISKEISKEQFYNRGLMIDYLVNFMNSLSLGFLAYAILRVLKQYKWKT